MTLVFINVQIAQIAELSAEGFTTAPTASQYEILRYKKNKIVLVLYSSGKLVVQTSHEQEDYVERILAKIGITTKAKEKRAKKEQVIPFLEDLKTANALIGSDETLKGDTFGGLVVSSAYFTKKEADQLKEIGVRDSKLLTDEKIALLANELLALFPERFAVQIITPHAYNKKIETMSSTDFLNELHTLVGEELQARYGESIPHVVDEYPGCTAGTYHMPKAEQEFVVVAAASIVARYYGLRQLGQLSAQIGFILPKGSTHVREALQKVVELKKEMPSFAKLHFSNVQKVLKEKN